MNPKNPPLSLHQYFPHFFVVLVTLWAKHFSSEGRMKLMPTHLDYNYPLFSMAHNINILSFCTNKWFSYWDSVSKQGSPSWMNRVTQKSHIRDQWDMRFEEFALQEALLRKRNSSRYNNFVLYDRPSRDQYEIFWCKFTVKLYKWIK